jgi:hypothetical protein
VKWSPWATTICPPTNSLWENVKETVTTLATARRVYSVSGEMALKPFQAVRGDGSSNSDYCFVPLEICEGDCRDDYDCENGLVCLQPSSSNADPGCNISEDVTDFCLVPEDGQLVLMGDGKLPTDKLPLG